MNSAELIAELSKRLQLPKSEVTRQLNGMVETIASELVQNNTVTVHNFGNFEVKKRDERISVNPSSGKRMLIPPKLIVKFRTSSTLKEKLKGLKP